MNILVVLFPLALGMGLAGLAAFFWSLWPACAVGTKPLTDTTSSGDVPQVTMGGRLAASSRTSRSKCAPSSVTRLSQYFIAMSQAMPEGAIGRPFR